MMRLPHAACVATGLSEAAKLASFKGQQKRVDGLVTAMNRAAEAAVPEAKAPERDPAEGVRLVEVGGPLCSP